jgi:hypothetical protein
MIRYVIVTRSVNRKIFLKGDRQLNSPYNVVIKNTYLTILKPLPGFTTQKRPSPTRRGTGLNFSLRQGEVSGRYAKLSSLIYFRLLTICP